MTTDKLTSIQMLRGLAVLGVVGFHTLAIERKYSGGDLLLPAVLQLGQAGVDLFFVISGFVMVLVTHGRFGSGREVVRFLWNRAARIYPTYWFYFFVTLAVFVARPNLVNASQGHQANLLASFLLLPDDRLPLVMVGWSLIHELWFYLAFAALLLLRERLLAPMLLSWAAVIVAVNVVVDVDALSAGLRVVFHAYTIEFLIGAFGALLVRTNLARRTSPALAWLALVTALAGFSFAAANGALDGADLSRALLLGSAFGTLLVSAVLLEQRQALPVSRALCVVGDNSYTIYLSHTLVLSALGRAWMATGPASTSLLDNAIAAAVMVTAVIVYGRIGYRLIEQPAGRLARRIRGRLTAASAPVA